MLNLEYRSYSKEKINNLQNDRILKIANYVNEKIPFYNDLFKKSHIKPSNINRVQDLSQIPFTTKESLRQNYPFNLFALPLSKIGRIHCSSGSTGKPTVVGYSKNDLKLFSEVMARSLLQAGLKPGMILQNSYGYGLFTGGLGFHYGAEQLGLTVIPASSGMTERQLLLLKDFNSDAICCTPSYAQTLAEEILSRKIDNLNLKFAILGAESWTETVRKQIESQLDIIATNHYGLSEIIGPGVAQEDFEERGTGSYIWEDHFYPEIVHPMTGELVDEGQHGVLVLTSFTKEAMPLIRYWTNDITNLYYDSSGKMNFRKIGPIIGRADEMLIVKGVNLFHTQIEAALEGFEDLTLNYQLIVSKKNYLDEVEVRVELTENLTLKTVSTGKNINEIFQINEIKERLKRKIKETIGLNMDISILKQGTLPRSDGGKLKRVIDLRG